ncbi:MAG: YfdX family protein [Chlorobi bacterium]|nr:YfdX family protein [Chlorobiota bacterium]
MKKFNSLLIGLAVIALSACNNNPVKKELNSPVPQKEKTLEMNADTLNAMIYADILDEIVKRREAIPAEALSVVAETQNLLQLIEAGKKDEAIEYGHNLIGKLEVLLAKDPSLSFLPVDANFTTDELVTDIGTVRAIVKAAKEAMDDGYYQAAAKILHNLRSEVIISSYYLPTVTYPDAIKVAVAFLEDGKTDDAKTVLQQVISSIIVEKTVLPLPVLKAEQMVIEAAKIDAKDHENADKVVNLLKNARYQLMLAEEMGYGKHDKDYKILEAAIDELQNSVVAKSDSKTAFDSLKANIRKFKDRLFPRSEAKNRTDKTKETKTQESK